MAISAPIRNCRRLSGYPFSLTREMSIRFFGYFASENERATGVRAISLPGFFLYTLELCANDVPNISVAPPPPLLSSPRPLSSTLDRPFTATVSDAPLDPRSRPPPRISHVTFRILSFFAASLFPSPPPSKVPRPCCRLSYSAFRCSTARSHASPQPREFIERNLRRERKRERDRSLSIPRMFLHLGMNRSPRSPLFPL